MGGLHSWQATEYIECIARSSRDPDMQGYAVRLSSAFDQIGLKIGAVLTINDSLHCQCHAGCVVGATYLIAKTNQTLHWQRYSSNGLMTM